MIDLESRDYDLPRKLSSLLWAIEDEYDPEDVYEMFTEMEELIDELYTFWKARSGQSSS